MLNEINPVLPGCHPDPSVCRVGDDYWLVVSSFTYWPALPVFHSRDLVAWEPAGHVIDRPEQLSLDGLETSDGIWAPTIRHHDGVFYVVSTVADDRQGAFNFVATAVDPRGPWSQPVDLGVKGIDPSLFFDTDGRCWFTICRDSETRGSSGPGEIWMREFDVDALALVGPEYVLWHGAVSGAWVEAPHIVRRDGVYHLLGAEGGTERRHSVTAARATAVTGPWATDPRSPLLTHRHLSPEHPIQNVGHADLVDTPSGETWAVVLAVRPVDGVHALGRETFLVPVEWTPDGPVFAPGTGMVQSRERVPAGATAPRQPAVTRVHERVHFDAGLLPTGWSSIRGQVVPKAPAVASTESGPVGQPGAGMRLALSQETLSTTATPAFIARRQQHLDVRATARVEFDPVSSTEEAGLALFHAGHRWASVVVTLDEQGRRICAATADFGDGPARGGAVLLSSGPAVLAVSADRDEYRLSLVRGPDASEEVVLARHPRSAFSTEEAGGFVGVHIGIHASSGGRPSGNSAFFPWFDYDGWHSST
ncbi:glycoside hydrolase family 43 protein [Curtobacterium albidum]|uniref:Glycoside hydrolase family 43 protein n=1 Tax=Curtobacterium citreum TaxID=2036 RepID=A0A850DUR2_9MICO|nr:glycoside hydrolase family 43 protein [Curtobacterium albidum]NUU29207.1 glycoside hydrolase family 43 protein [Curtobacterium albidum]